MAKKFFYVCGGLFLLVLSYQIGARSAGAQAGSVSFVASQGYNGGGAAALVAYPNGDVYHFDAGCGTCGGWELTSNVFGGDPQGRAIIQLDKDVAVASSGEVFTSIGSAQGPWINRGVPAGGPTPVRSESWGSVKARYRDAQTPSGEGR